MPPAALALAPVAAGLIGSVISGNAQNHAAQQAQNAANQDTQQQNALNAQQMAIIQQFLSSYDKNQAPLEGGASSAEQGLLGVGQGAGQDTQSYINSLLNPTSTGVDTRGLAGNVIGDASDTSGTNLAGVTPGALDANKSSLGFFLDQMKNGAISPDLIANALGQNQAGSAQQINTIRSGLGGRENVGSLVGDASRTAEESQASLLANLTGQSQGLRNNAASGASSAASALTSTASNLDSQKLAMLLQAFGVGQTQQQTQLGNQGLAAGSATGALGGVNQYIDAGKASVTGQQGPLAGLSSQAGASAAGSAGVAAQDSTAAAANNPFSSLGNGLASYLAQPRPQVQPRPPLLGVGALAPPDYNGTTASGIPTYVR